MKFQKRFVQTKAGRVLLRKVRLSDARVLNKIFNTPRVNCFMLWPPSSLASTIKSIRKNFGPKDLDIVAVLKGKVVGRVSLKQRDGRQSHVGRFGIYVAPGFQGKGIATAMANALFETARKNGIKKIESSYFADNKVSASLHKSLGFEPEGLRKKSLKRGNKYFDHVMAGKWLK